MAETETGHDDQVVKTEKEIKKKKKKSKAKSYSDHDHGGDENPKKKKKKKKKREESSEGSNEGDDDNGDDRNSGVAEVVVKDLGSTIKTQSDCKKYSVDYFRGSLELIRIKCEGKLKVKLKDKEDFSAACKRFYDTWAENQENERWLSELVEGKNSKKGPGTEGKTTDQLLLEQTNHASNLSTSLTKLKKKCIKAAMKVFMGLKEDALMEIEEKLVKGAIISQATPEKLADFASKSKSNEKLIKRLFSDAELMKEMLLHGGAVKYDYMSAIRIYVDCTGKHSMKDGTEEQEDKFSTINHKIALACALELASPIYEFDSTVPVDPVARYNHFVDAHKAGELDPSFPFFSVWEIRQIVNCDAPNDQMAWCRKMVCDWLVRT